MARRTKDGKYFGIDYKILKNEADTLALHYGFNPNRIRRVFEKIALDCCENPPFKPWSEIKDTISLFFQYLSPGEALSILEMESLKRLVERMVFVNYLTENTTPLYNLKDLEHITESLLSHLELNRENLVKTGHSMMYFRLSPWLNLLFNSLYYVKVPWKLEIIRNELGDFASYSWLSQFIEDEKPVSVPYEDAAIIEGLNPKDAARIEADRNKMFNLRIGIIKEILWAVQARTTANLWGNCLQLLTEALTIDEVNFYLRMDHFYSGYDVKSGKITDEKSGLNTGGLTNLLWVIGHYEKEITIGALARTRHALGDLIKPDWLNRPRLTLSSSILGINQREKEIIDAADDIFMSLEAQEGSFWNDYRRRVNEALENEFCEEVLIRTKVKRKLVHKFEPNVRTYSEWAKAQLEANGCLPQLLLSQPVISSSDEGNVFRKEGEYWTIAYKGKDFRLKDAKGLHYIAHLLRHPRQEFPAIQLVAMLKGGQIDPDTNIYNGMSEKQLAKEGLSASVDLGSADPILDSKAIADYKRRLQELREDREEAKELGNSERLEEIDKKTDLIESQLRSATGLGGRNRKFGDSSNKIRKSVTNRINSSLKKIKKEHPELWQHLRNSIKTGSLCIYNPEKDIHWSL